VPHDSAAVAEAIAAARDNGAEAILVCGASAISDRRDVVPAAVVDAGGVVDRIGPAGGSRKSADVGPYWHNASNRHAGLRAIAPAERF
jgi:hypothetical protein